MLSESSRILSYWTGALNTMFSSLVVAMPAWLDHRIGWRFAYHICPACSFWDVCLCQTKVKGLILKAHAHQNFGATYLTCSFKNPTPAFSFWLHKRTHCHNSWLQPHLRKVVSQNQFHFMTPQVLYARVAVFISPLLSIIFMLLLAPHSLFGMAKAK